MSDYLQEKEKYLLEDTLTVSDLVNILFRYPPNTKVMITWESTVNGFKKENIYLSHTGTLYFDADGNFYKKEYAKNAGENE